MSLATKEAFDAYPAEARQRHFIRRTKEEMVTLDGKPLYPARISGHSQLRPDPRPQQRTTSLR